MSGVYIHIPFCRKACNYCNFHFSTSPKLQQAFIDALLLEIVLQKSYLTEAVSTIYFGGGTPSILAAEEIERILSALRANFTVNADVEITLEANPDDISTDKLLQWKATGVNRLSIGIQSFFEADLQWMNRAHNVEQAKQCIQLAHEEGFYNISIDLIYGTPTLTDEQWKQNVEQAIAFHIPHLSCYALTVEPKTALEKLISSKQLAPVDNEKQAHHFELLMQWMKDAGYEHYEISNFAKPGSRSKHNSSYWQGSHYVGLGPSAHSFNGVSRQWNVANNALYIQSLQQGIVPFEQEVLTDVQQVNEYIMTGLRTMEGVSLKKLNDFGKIVTNDIMQAAREHVAQELLIVEDDYLRTTNKGKLLADGIASDLFLTEKV
jgi:oxygen-independent coproporphyrinogen-3 oxidase